MITDVALISMHTSPLLLPGAGDAGGMNVYVDRLARTMIDRGIDVTIFTRRADVDLPDTVELVPGCRVSSAFPGGSWSVFIPPMSSSPAST